MNWIHRASGVLHRPGDSGLTVAVVGSLHGDEPAGAATLRRIQSWPESRWAGCRHSVVLAVGNPAALALGVRAVPGHPDLNRCFGTGEGRDDPRAAALRDALSDVDVLLDLHQTRREIPPLAVLPDGGEALALSLARRLGLGVAVSGAALAYGRAMLADWVVGRGGRALTVELGSVADPGCVDRAEALAHALLFDEDRRTPVRVWQIKSILRCPGADLRFLRPLVNESAVHAGERLGTSGGGDLVAPEDGVVFLPTEHAEPGSPAALFAVAVS